MVIPEGIVDLHTHSTHSDGSLSPVDLIYRAAKNGVSVLSITDHDSVEAYNQELTLTAASSSGIELVTGVEVSSQFRGKGLHILGLFIDHSNPELSDMLDTQQLYRKKYSTELRERFIEGGWLMPKLPIHHLAQTITKAQLAETIITQQNNVPRLLELFGHVPTRGEFIERLMNPGGTFYLRREHLEPEQVISVIHAAGGLAVYAHPIAGLNEGVPMEIVKSALSKLKFDAIEALYYYHNQSKGGRLVDGIEQMKQLAEEYHLAISGGSDYHGPNDAHGAQVEVGFAGFLTYPGIDIFDILRSKLHMIKS